MRVFEISADDFQMMHYHRCAKCGDTWGHPIPSCSGMSNAVHPYSWETKKCKPFKYVVNDSLKRGDFGGSYEQ